MFEWTGSSKERWGRAPLFYVALYIILRLIDKILDTLFRFNIENLAQKLDLDNVFGSEWFVMVWNLVTDSHVFAFALGAVIFAFWDTIGNSFKRVYSAITGRQIAPSKRHMGDPNYPYQQQILAVAKSNQKAARGRLKAANDRLRRRDIDRMVDGIRLEGIDCPKLVNADQGRLSHEQTILLEDYIFRENELKNIVNEVSNGLFESDKPKAATSFRHRIKELSEALDKLISEWYLVEENQ